MGGITIPGLQPGPVAQKYLAARGPNDIAAMAGLIARPPAFNGFAASVSPRSLVGTAGQFGFGTDPALGRPAFGGYVPLPSDQVEKVATAIGQGRVQACPRQMAVVAAAWPAATSMPALVSPAGAKPAGPGWIRRGPGWIPASLPRCAP